MATPCRTRTPGHTKAVIGLEPPRLDLAGLRHDLEQFHIEVTASSWQNPTPEFAEELYLSAVRVLLDCQPEDARFDESSFQNGSLDDSRLYIQGIGNLRFLRLCQKTCGMIGIDDFSILDLTKPDGERTYRFGCAFINFVRYREKRLVPHHPMLREAESSCDALGKLSDEYDKALEHLASLEASMPNICSEIEQRKKQHSDLEEVMNAKQDQIRSLEAQLEQQKHEATGLQQRIDERDKQLASSLQLAQDLEGQVVQSPNRLKQATVDLQDKLQHESQKRQAVQNKISRMKSNHEFLEAVEKRLKKKIRLCHLINVKVQEMQEASKAVAAAQAEEAQHRDLAQNLRQDEAQLHAMCESLATRRGETETRLSGLLAAAEQKLAARKSQARSEEERAQRLQIQLCDMEREVANLKLESEVLDGRIAVALQQFEKLSSQLKKAFDDYKSGVRAATQTIEQHEEYRRSVLPMKVTVSQPKLSHGEGA